MSLFSFVYESPADVASEDVELWKELDLPLETGEAFPDANLFSPDGTRRPTPKEIDFLTIVLKGLAQTSEEELDSGRWTKSVHVSGKRRKCTFSIPNLLSPPDRAEWIRRGKMPDRRSHEIHFRQVQEFIDSVGEGMNIDELNEAINARFTGRSLDDYELPRNTPSERAEALYQDALECYGRRRVLLAREALAEDASHVEASILVAESTRAVDRRMELFQNAKQSAATALGKDMEGLAGEFWGFHETRSYMRPAMAWPLHSPTPVRSVTRSSNIVRCSGSIPTTTRACATRLSRYCWNKIATPKPLKCSTNTQKSRPCGCT